MTSAGRPDSRDEWWEWWARLAPVDVEALAPHARLDLMRALVALLDLADDPALWREAAELASRARIVAVAKHGDPESGP